MSNILILRDFFIRLYRRFDFILVPLLKFLLAFFILFFLQNQAGYFERFSSPLIISVFSLISAFFPLGCISFMAGLFLVLDMFEVSYIMAAVGAGVLVLILLLYYGFKPGTGIVISLVPLFFFLRMPLLLPVYLGLTVGIYAVVPALSGVLCYQLTAYFIEHASSLSSVGTDELTEAFLTVIRGVLMDRYMLLIMGAFAAAIIVSSVVSRLGINFAHISGALAGTITGAIIMGAADLRYQGAFVSHLAGVIVSLILISLYVLVFYAADYRGTERLEFEDDDYYYFVKAVPKIKAQDPEEYL